MDEIYESPWLGHSYISGTPEVLKNREMFDVYGITHLLVSQKDYDALDKKYFRNMTFIGRYQANSGNLLLLKNMNVWPKSYLLDSSVMEIKSKQKICNVKGGVCNDYSYWLKHRLEDDSKITGSSGSYAVELPAASTERVFITSKLYRPEWIALSGETKLKVFKMNGGLLGVIIPPNISHFIILYNDKIRGRLMVLSILTILSVLALIFLTYLSSKRRAQSPSATIF
jgi:hypothetical protein